MRANVVDVDIPEEISQYAELKTLTEDVGRNARVISGVFCKAAEWRKTDQWREGEDRSRGAQERSDVTTMTISNVCPMCQTHVVQAFRSGRCFMNRSARALKWEAWTETEAPYESRPRVCFHCQRNGSATTAHETWAFKQMVPSAQVHKRWHHEH